MPFGLSSRPTTWGSDTNITTGAIDEVIGLMNQLGLTLYRMCIWTTIPTQDIINFARYFLDNCSHTLILNHYHNTNPSGMGATEWSESTNKALSILSALSSYQDRIIIEPYNQVSNSDAQMTVDIQNFVDTIRGAGYTCKIYCSRWYTQNQNTFINITDSLYGHIVCGQQQYINTIGLQGAINRTLAFVNAGVEVLDGEVGAHTGEYRQFTQFLVNEVSSYLDWCNNNGVSACVWTLQGTRDYEYVVPNFPNDGGSYQQFGLVFPVEPEPPEGLIIDDEYAAFTGTWIVSSFVQGYYGTGYHYSEAGAGENLAVWQFTPSEDGLYEIFAGNAPYSNRATNAPYTVSHKDGETTVHVNQRTATETSLGQYGFLAGQTATVTLSNEADGFVIADSIRVLKVGELPPEPPEPTAGISGVAIILITILLIIGFAAAAKKGG